MTNLNIHTDFNGPGAKIETTTYDFTQRLGDELEKQVYKSAIQVVLEKIKSFF